MRKFFTVIMCLFLMVSILVAASSKQEQRFNKAMKQKAADDPQSISNSLAPIAPKALAKATNAPGTFLFNSTYDIEGNGSGQNGIINYGDGTLGFARMASQDKAGGAPDRGSFFSYFDGTNWTEAVRVEGIKRGWTSTDAMADGRQVVFAHTGNEANVDALKGFGIWTSALTGYIAGAVDHIWARIAVDGSDNIHAVSTLRAQIAGARYATYYPVHSWSTDQGLSWQHQYIFGDPFTEIDTTDGQWQGFAVDAYAIDAIGNKVGIVALAGGAIGSDNLWLGLSEDNGASWAIKKLTENKNLPERGVDVPTPTTAMDLIFDNSGNVHVFSTNFLNRLDSAGTSIDQFHSATMPMRHWSEATGWVDMFTFENIPGFDPNENVFDGTPAAVNDVGQNNTLLQLPQAGVDADGNIYVAFNTVVPHDTNAAGTNWMDVFVVGSGDGGATWGTPVNVTNNPGVQDMWATLADKVDDNLHIAYGSTAYAGHTTDVAGTSMDHYYLAVPKATIPLKPVSVTPKNSTIPDQFALHQNYPNPFNPTTNITFDLKTASNVNLSIYDVAGKLVTTLVNGKMTAGQYSVTWNADNMTSGVYFAKLQSDGFTSVKKMMLIK